MIAERKCNVSCQLIDAAVEPQLVHDDDDDVELYCLTAVTCERLETLTAADSGSKQSVDQQEQEQQQEDEKKEDANNAEEEGDNGDEPSVTSLLIAASRDTAHDRDQMISR